MRNIMTNYVKPEFLKDLQGIRAIAVLLVLIYHLWPDYLPGGFIGVDVFFVLSGFLMTKILLQDHRKNGTISIRRFLRVVRNV